MPSIDLAASSTEEDWSCIHRILPPTEDYHSIRIEVTPPISSGFETKYFETPDLESLMEALTYAGTFPFAREMALRRIRAVVRGYKQRIWRPKIGEGFVEWVNAGGISGIEDWEGKKGEGGGIGDRGDERGEGQERRTGEGADDGDAMEEGGIRKEVWEMVRLLCIQEGRLLDFAWDTLNDEIPG